MTTVDQKTARDIVLGLYPNDPSRKIVTYRNMFDNSLVFATVLHGEDPYRYEPIRKSGDMWWRETVWTKEKGLTSYGIEVLDIKIIAAGVRPYPE